MANILITGARAPIALELARSFANSGHLVIMADSLQLTISRWSNRIAKYYLLPAPSSHLNEFVLKLQEIILKEDIQHIIPTCEEAVYIASRQNEFPCKVWTSSLETILKLHNKYWFTQSYNKWLPVPETVLLTEFKDWGNSKQYVFKPCFSRFASSVILRKEIQPYYFGTDHHKWIAQAFISGKEICVYSIWDQGNLKAYSAYHPLYRAGKGAGIFFEPTTNETILQLVKKFGQHINYTGQLSFDVIVSEENKPYFIECNPRGTSGGHLLNKQLSDAFLSNGAIKFADKREYVLSHAMVLLHPFAFLKKRIRQAKDPVFNRKDIKPYFLQALSLFEITFIKLSKGISWLAATTTDIEWNGNED